MQRFAGKTALVTGAGITVTGDASDSEYTVNLPHTNEELQILPAVVASI